MKIVRKGKNPVVEIKNHKGMDYLVFPALQNTGIVDHMFSTRIGGVSEGMYASVNFHYEMGDVKEHVDENYRRVSEILGHNREIEDFVLGQQTHTVNVREVSASDRGKGVVRDRDYKDVDALITNTPGLILTTFHADCTPVYIVDPVHKAIGLAHSGWKGTVGRIADRTISAMREVYGTEAADCICAVGPSICGDCYEVGGELIEAFGKEFDDISGIYRDGENGKYYLDLWAANKMVLREAGVPEENISVTDLCTRCNPDFMFSHRITGFNRGTCAAFLSLRI